MSRDSFFFAFFFTEPCVSILCISIISIKLMLSELILMQIQTQMGQTRCVKAWKQQQRQQIADSLPHSLESGRGEETPRERLDGGMIKEGKRGRGTNKHCFSFINLCVITVRRQRTVYEPGDLCFFFFLLPLFFQRKRAILTPPLRPAACLCSRPCRRDENK